METFFYRSEFSGTPAGPWKGDPRSVLRRQKQKRGVIRPSLRFPPFVPFREAPRRSGEPGPSHCRELVCLPRLQQDALQTSEGGGGAPRWDTCWAAATDRTGSPGASTAVPAPGDAEPHTGIEALQSSQLPRLGCSGSNLTSLSVSFPSRGGRRSILSGAEDPGSFKGLLVYHCTSVLSGKRRNLSRGGSLFPPRGFGSAWGMFPNAQTARALKLQRANQQLKTAL